MAAAAAAEVSKARSSLKETVQKAMTHGVGNESVKTVEVEDVCAMIEIPDFQLCGNKRNGTHKLNMALSTICRGGLYGEKEGVGTIAYGSFEGDHLQY